MGKVFAAGIAATFVIGFSAKPWLAATVAEVGENGCFMMGNGAVGDRTFPGMNRRRTYLKDSR